MYNIKRIIAAKPWFGMFLPYLKIATLFPLFLLMHITMRCTQSCKSCYQKNDSSYLDYAGEMDVGLFENLLKNARFYKPHIHLFGGEPLLHVEFPAFIEICRRYGFAPSLTTNGDLIDAHTDVICKSSVSQINISINSLVNERESSVNKDFAAKVWAFLKKNKRKKIVNLNVMLSPWNVAIVEQIVSYAHEKYAGGFDFICIQHYNGSHRDFVKDWGNKNVERTAEFIRRLYSRRKKLKVIFLPDVSFRNVRRYYGSDDCFGNRCFVPWVGLSIFPDLSVTPGAGVLGCVKNIGNLNQDSLMTIWRNSQLKEFRLCQRQGQLSEKCYRCCQKLYS